MFEYVEKNLLEVLEENTVGIDVRNRLLQSTKLRLCFNLTKLYGLAKTSTFLRLSDD